MHALAVLLGAASVSGGQQVPRPPEAGPVALEWHAPAGCPNEDEVRERLQERFPEGTRSTLSVVANIAADAEGFAVALALANEDGEGERRFRARDCGLLTDAIVLVVAVTIDPIAVAERIRVEALKPAESEPAESEPEPLPEATRAPEPDPAPASVPRPLPAPAPRRARVRAGTRVLGGGGYGPTRGGHGMVGGSLAVLGDGWRAELLTVWTTPRVIVRDRGIGGTFDGWSVTPRGCFVPVVAQAIELPLCAGVELGRVRGQGLEGLAHANRVGVPWVAPVLAFGLAWLPTDALALGMELDLAAPVTRAGFVVDEGELQHRVERIGPVAVRVLAGIEVRLPGSRARKRRDRR